jgi:hypothetical protein
VEHVACIEGVERCTGLCWGNLRNEDTEGKIIHGITIDLQKVRLRPELDLSGSG